MQTLETLRNGLGEALRAFATPRYTVADRAPSTLAEVAAHYSATRSICVWSGESESSIWGAQGNYRFRAWHDALHLSTGIGFEPIPEIEIGRYQARIAGRFGDAFARLVEIETAGQAAEFLRSGAFVADQIAFAIAQGAGR